VAAQGDTIRTLLERHGRTYAEEAGIRLRDTPGPLYQLLVLSVLLSARISAGVAVAGARELFAAGYRSPRKMLDSSWQHRVDALGRGSYRRYDERTATMLGDGAQLLLDRWKGDLRRLHRDSEDTAGVQQRLQEIPGIGPTGASIFCREVQGIWPDVAPYVDDRAGDGAARLGLPRSAERLASSVAAEDLPRLVAACVRAALDEKVVEDVRRAQR
jgi:endonuclease III